MRITYTIQLEENDLGQLLDGLRCRSESWHGTAVHLDVGHNSRADFVIEECSSADEAREIANDYDRIIATIEGQIKKQRKPSS